MPPLFQNVSTFSWGHVQKFKSYEHLEMIISFENQLLQIEFRTKASSWSPSKENIEQDIIRSCCGGLLSLLHSRHMVLVCMPWCRHNQIIYLPPNDDEEEEDVDVYDSDNNNWYQDNVNVLNSDDDNADDYHHNGHHIHQIGHHNHHDDQDHHLMKMMMVGLNVMMTML